MGVDSKVSRRNSTNKTEGRTHLALFKKVEGGGREREYRANQAAVYGPVTTVSLS